MAASEGQGSGAEDASSPGLLPPASSATPGRRLSDLRVIDLRAELKRRNLDSGGNKGVLLERLRRAIEEEGGNPDELPVTAENSNKRTPKRTVKGRKPEEEDGEDNGLEENSRDEQEDTEASSDNLQSIDMMDISVLDEAETDNSSAVDCRDDYIAENVLDSDEKDNTDAEMKELPDQLMDNEENGEELDNMLDAASPDLAAVKDLEYHTEPENEKMLDILGDTCKSEPFKEDTSEAEQAQEEKNPLAGKKAAEEEEDMPAATTALSEEDLLETESPSAPTEGTKQEEAEAKHLVVAAGEPSEQPGEEAQPDSDSVAVESRSGGGGGGGGGGGDESSKTAAQSLEASSEASAAGQEAAKTEEKSQCEEDSSSATREASAPEGGDQNTSSNEDPEAKGTLKDEKAQTSSSSSGKNLWVSGLSSSTRATDLKNLFSKYGKVMGAKVVTNARSPGARCYGFVTMSSSEEATKCISHLHRTELHGKMISVEKAKTEPAGKKTSLDKKENEEKKEKERHHSVDSKSEKSPGVKKEDKADKKGDLNKLEEKDGGEGKERSGSKAGSVDRARSVKSASRGTERTVVMDKSKGEPVISVKTTTTSKERSTKSHDRKSESKEEQDILSFDKIKEQRERERQRQREREIRETERRRERERREREQRIQAVRERDERQRLQRERERLEFQRQRLERERMERERLERERMHIEQERRREQERIQREREELRRQQEQLRYAQERRSALRRPYDPDGRRDDPYWSETKRMAMEDRYHSDFGRQDRLHGFDHRDRGRYQDHPVDRREGSRGLPDRDGQHYPDDRHGGPERHSRDGWGGYGSDRRSGRDWGDHGHKLEGHQDRSWQDGEMVGRDHERWQGGDRGISGPAGPGHVMGRGGMSGRGGFVQGGAQNPAVPGTDVQGGFAGQDRPNRPNDARFARRY